MRILSAFILMCLASVSFGQFKAGDFEVTLSGSGASTNDFDTNSFGATGSIGYFLTDQFEVSLRQGVFYADDNIVGTTGVGLDFNFAMGKFVPFVGGLAGFSYGHGIDFGDSFNVGVEGGLKYFVNQTTFIYGSLDYAVPVADFDFDQGLMNYKLGVGFRF